MTAFSQIEMLPPQNSRARNLALAILGLAPILYGCIALYLGQDSNWDLRNYHWYNAYAVWTGRLDQDLLPAQTPSFYNPALDVPFYLLATHVPARAAFFALALVQGLNFVLLFFMAHACLLISNPVRKVGIAAALAAVGVLGAGGIAQIGATFYDNVTSLGTFASALVVILRLEVFRKAPLKKALLWAALAGIPAGVTMGLKLPSVTFCAGLCLAMLCIFLPWKRRLPVAIAFGVGIVVGLAVSFGPWGLYLWNNYANPVFPYFNNFFQSPFAPSISARDTKFLPHGWSDWLFFPFIFSLHPMRVGEIPWQDFRIAALYALLPAAALARLFYADKKSGLPLAWGEAARFLLWFAVFSYFAWLALFAIYRYALPLEMLSPLLTVVAIGLFPVRRKTRAIWATIVLVTVAVTTQGGNWGRTDHWLPRAMEVVRPEIADPADTMILMAGYEPYSHVISEFPPEASFVRLQSNFTQIGYAPAMEKKIRGKIEAHKEKGGHFKMLIPTWQHRPAFDILVGYGLRLDPRSCQEVDDLLYDKFDLCDVVPAARNRKARK
jgi:hypothetical protein